MPALFSKTTPNPGHPVLSNEIGHPHEKDGSMYLVVYADARKMIEDGYGEHYPLCANGKKYWTVWHAAHGLHPVCRRIWFLVYAPRIPEHKKVMTTCTMTPLPSQLVLR